MLLGATQLRVVVAEAARAVPQEGGTQLELLRVLAVEHDRALPGYAYSSGITLDPLPTPTVRHLSNCGLIQTRMMA